MDAFIIWALCGLFFVILGIYDFFSKKQKAFGFWANAETFPVDEVGHYNRAMGKLWIVYGIVFILIGLPLLGGRKSPFAILLILGPMFEAIVCMAVYVTVIEKKYRKK